MKLYAQVSSERATEGQGGNEFILVELKGEGGQMIVDLQLTIKNGSYVLCMLGDEENIILERPVFITEKGEKKKSECTLCGGEMGGNHSYNCPRKGK